MHVLSSIAQVWVSQASMHVDILGDLWDLKWTDICITELWEEYMREKGKKLFKELIAEKFLELERETDVHLQEAERVSNEMAHTITLYNYIVKFKDKKRNF